MRDPYERKQAEKQTGLMEEIEEEAERQTEKIEEENRQKTWEARKSLEKAAQKHRMTTEEMQRQNETLENARKEGFATYKHAEKAKAQAAELEHRENAFDVLASAKVKGAQWMGRDRAAEADVEQMEQRKFSEDEEPSSQQMERVSGEAEGTDKNLQAILKNVRDIRKESARQSKETKKQETRLGDIMKTSEYAKKAAKDADERLRKNLEK